MSVTIIGGGIVGVTLALSLSRFNNDALQINIVEEKEIKNQYHPSFDSRAIALSEGTYRELKAIGIWSILESCATAIKKIEVSTQDQLNKIQISASDYQISALGYVVELFEARKKLFELLQKVPSIRLYCPATIKNIKREQTDNIITLNNQIKFDTKLLIAADGTTSSLAKRCGIRWWQRDYQQIAVIANIITELSHESNAFERFLSKGHLALLPMSEGTHSALVWCLSDAYKKNIVGWDEKWFCQELQQAFGWRLGRIVSVGKRYYYPIQLFMAKRHIAHRLALVGNAAQTLHPIAAQGLNLGLRDALTLSEVVTQAVKKGEDIGDYAVLLRYQCRRRIDQIDIIGITDGLVRLFTNQNLPLVVCRNIGLIAMARIPVLRDMLIHKMLGRVAS